MADLAPIVVGVLVGLATALLIVALVGRADDSRPRCRACKRDARPCAWREPRTCDCGADLARSNAVRAGRRRGWRAFAAAAILLGAAIILTLEGMRLGTAGGQWRDHLPAPIFGALLGGDCSDDNLRSLGARLRRGLGPGEAQSILQRVLAGSTARNPANADIWLSIVWSLIEAAPPLELDDASCVAFLAGPPIDVVYSGDEHAALLTLGQGLAPFGSTYLRIDSIDVDGRAAEFEVRDAQGRRYDGWFSFLSGPVIRVPNVTADDRQPTITMHGRMMWLATNQRVDGDPTLSSAAAADDAPIVLRPELSPVQPTTGRFVASPRSAASMPFSGRQNYQDFEWRCYQAMSFDRAELARPYVLAAIAAAVGTAPAFACFFFGFRAGRGWHGLERPRCQRCSMLLRSSDDALPERCVECGADLRQPRATRWLEPRRSPLSLALTVPVTLIGGLAIAVLAGASSWFAVDHKFSLIRPDHLDLAMHLADRVEACEDDAQFAASRLAAESTRWVSAPSARERELVRRLLALVPKVAGSSGGWQIRRLLGLAYPKLQATDPDCEDARAIADDMQRSIVVAVPTRVFVNDPVKIELVSLVASAAASIDGAGPARLWASPFLAATARFDTVGRHRLDVEIFCDPTLLNSAISTAAQCEEFAGAAEWRRRETHEIEVVDDLARLAEPIVDSAHDPFATPGLQIYLSVIETNGCREAMLHVRGPRGDLLVGRWTLTLDGVDHVMPDVSLGSNTVTTMFLPSGAMPDSVRMRFGPEASTVVAPGLCAERPRWGVERSLELRRVQRTHFHGREVASYAWSPPDEKR